MSVFEQRILDILRSSPFALSAIEVWRRLGWRRWLIGPPVWLTLYRLEQAGSVGSHWVDGPYPRRRVYWDKAPPITQAQGKGE
jgi:hypothetical protein